MQAMPTRQRRACRSLRVATIFENSFSPILLPTATFTVCLLKIAAVAALVLFHESLGSRIAILAQVAVIGSTGLLVINLFV
jgi:hypothetical protein